MVRSETTRSFYHRNALGSVMEITDMNEADVVSYRYDPYGAVTITVGGTPQGSDPLGNPWMYTGRFTDEETGLYYYRARFYSPLTGRFLQRDPLGYVSGANAYSYASAAPTCRIDPLGLKDTPAAKALKVCGGATAAAESAMAGCTGDAYTTPRQCQECCGFAAWDAMAVLGSAATTLASDCSTEYADDKEKAEEMGAIPDGMEELEHLEHAETAAEVAGAIAEGVAAEAGGGIGAGAGLGYHLAGSYAAIKGAIALMNIVASGRATALNGDNKYITCMKQGAGYIANATQKLESLYNGCMNACRNRWGKNCGITENKKAWNWLLHNDDYRIGD